MPKIIITTDASYAKAIKLIEQGVNNLAESIHDAGIYALQQVNAHGNIGFATRLIEAIGKKGEVKRVEKWFCHFGKCGMKNNTLVYRKRKDINEGTVDKVMTDALNTPYWELTKQEHNKFSVNYLTMLKSLLTQHEKAEGLRKEGKEAKEDNVAILVEVQALLAKYTTLAQPAAAVAA